MYAPILLFVYNRPTHLRRTVEALQANVLAGESDLFIYADAARDADACPAVDEVRAYIRHIGGFRSVTLIERDENWGLARNIIDGVTTQVNRFGRVIVLEDDLVTCFEAGVSAYSEANALDAENESVEVRKTYSDEEVAAYRAGLSEDARAEYARFGLSPDAVEGVCETQFSYTVDGEELGELIALYRPLRGAVAEAETFFVTEKGAPLYGKLVYDVVCNALSGVTSGKRSPHTLRHSYASAMLNHGAGINSVKELLGHESLAATQIYTHITYSELKQNYKQAHPRALKKGG